MGGIIPRKNAKGKWNIEKNPEELYWENDPFKILDENNYKEELLKAHLICGLIKPAVETGIDIGCGEGYWTNIYSKKIKRMWGIDISHIAIGRAINMFAYKYSGNENYLQFLQGDITKGIPINICCHCVIMSEVLYYIKPSSWEIVSKNIRDMLPTGGQFIISCGQFFSEKDIREIFDWCEFEKTFKLPSKRYEYNLIMSGVKKRHSK